MTELTDYERDLAADVVLKHRKQAALQAEADQLGDELMEIAKAEAIGGGYNPRKDAIRARLSQIADELLK